MAPACDVPISVDTRAWEVATDVRLDKVEPLREGELDSVTNTIPPVAPVSPVSPKGVAVKEDGEALVGGRPTGRGGDGDSRTGNGEADTVVGGVDASRIQLRDAVLRDEKIAVETVEREVAEVLGKVPRVQ